MERDLAAIQAKLDALQAEADSIAKEHPEDAEVIRERRRQIQVIWEELTQMVCQRIITEISPSKLSYNILRIACS